MGFIKTIGCVFAFMVMASLGMAVTHLGMVLLRGYPKGGGVEGETRLTRPWRGVRKTAIRHPHFGPEEADVYAIRVQP